jgi:hypothetical protein
MKGKLLSLLLIVTMTIGLLNSASPFGKAQSGTNVSYIIGSDTTWTQANSPYNFTGNILVNQGVTLTIGADATVNLNYYYVRVNGTLIIQPGATINIGLIGDGIDVYGTMSAEGTSANPINIIGSVQGHIIVAFYSAVTFFPSSISWDPNTNSGSLIENTIFNDTGLEVQSDIRISDSTFLNGGLTVESASPTIVNNDIATGLSVIQNPNLSYNVANGTEIQPEISNNKISGGLFLDAGSGIVDDNTISAGSSYTGALSIDDEYSVPISTLILRNLINDSPIGISCNIQSSYNNKAIIENNTVTNNTVGVQIGSTNVPSVTNNNIYGNSYNVKLSGVSSQISLPNNWWGTTDVQAINKTMYDFKYDFNLGTINFLPILESANPEATPNPTAPTSSPTPSTPSPTASANSPSSSPSSQQTSSPSSSRSPSQKSSSTFTSTVLVAVVAIIIVVVAVVAFSLGKRTARKSNP